MYKGYALTGYQEASKFGDELKELAALLLRSFCASAPRSNIVPFTHLRNWWLLGRKRAVPA